LLCWDIFSEWFNKKLDVLSNNLEKKNKNQRKPMKIGGFVKQSLIDYPGKIAAVLFTQGCNFRCGYCHNPQLVLPEMFRYNPEHSKANILSYLKAHKNWLDGVVVTGGEPTIHKDLPELLKEIKDFGYYIKLDTNGSNPHLLDRIMKEKLADYIALDIKTMLSATEYSHIIGIKKSGLIVENVIASILLLKQSQLTIEFRTTKLPQIHTPQILELINQYLDNKFNYKINEFRPGDTIATF
jgi:pyruvate formate lyase activating enzyme